jgi:hypothetical protein
MVSVWLILCALYASSVLVSALHVQWGERVLRPTSTASKKRRNTTVMSLLAPSTTFGLASPAKHERIDWTVRPATIADANQTAKLLNESFYTILAQDYDQDTLSKGLPSITTPRQQLLTCGTWYVVEDPVTKDIVGCGGWSIRSRGPNSNATNATAIPVPQLATNATAIPAPQLATNATAIPAPQLATNATDIPVPQLATNATDIPVPQLRHFATRPGWTRRGIGKALWTRTLRDISEAVGPETQIDVFSTLTGEPFYSSLGFVPVRRVEVTLAKDCLFPVILMRRAPYNSSLGTCRDSFE